ncbi:AlbA family DNA-binding domain-containing protein [Methanolobus tindarius]|nr:ATP-binding protein [Methanolobus tindarius]
MFKKRKQATKTVSSRDNIRRVRLIFSIIFRTLLIVAGVSALLRNDLLNLSLSLFALVLTFLPTLIQKKWEIHFPSLFEILILIFIYLSVFPEIMGPVIKDLWWGDFVLNAISTVVIGAIAFSIVYLLFWEKKSHTTMTPAIIALFSFCLSFTIATVMEISIVALVNLFGFDAPRYDMGITAPNMTSNLFIDLLVSLLVSLAGYVYIHHQKGNLLDKMVTSFIEKNPCFFNLADENQDPSNALLELISKGEGNNLEFKSTMRINLHTSKPDKRIEHAVAKTMVAYLNSDGGCLLVGVSDDGSILGIEADNFQNNDKFNQHFSNIIAHNIGNEHLPFINSELIKVDDKFVLKVNCIPSDKPVFLKDDGKEEFYIRSSAASLEISGSKLIEYIDSRFKNNNQ